MKGRNVMNVGTIKRDCESYAFGAILLDRNITEARRVEMLRNVQEAQRAEKNGELSFSDDIKTLRKML